MNQDLKNNRSTKLGLQRHQNKNLYKKERDKKIHPVQYFLYYKKDTGDLVPTFPCLIKINE